MTNIHFDSQLSGELEGLRRKLYDMDGEPDDTKKSFAEATLKELISLFNVTAFRFGSLIGESLPNYTLDPRIWAEILFDARSIVYLPKELKENVDFMRVLLTHNASVYWLLEDKLKENGQLLLAALADEQNFDFENCQNIPQGLISDRQFCLEAIKVEPLFSFVISEQFRQDKEFAIEAVKINERSALGFFDFLATDSQKEALGDNPDESEIIGLIKSIVEHFHISNSTTISGNPSRATFKL